MPVIGPHALHQEKPTCTIAVRRNPMWTIYRYRMPFTYGEDHFLGRPQHFDAHATRQTVRRIGDRRMVMPRDLLTWTERALLDAHIRSLGHPIDVPGTHVCFTHDFAFLQLVSIDPARNGQFRMVVLRTVVLDPVGTPSMDHPTQAPRHLNPDEFADECGYAKIAASMRRVEMTQQFVKLVGCQ